MADPVHVVGGYVEWSDHSIENGVYAAHDLGIGALELLVLAAFGELTSFGRFGQSRQFLLQALNHVATLLTATFIFS